MTMRAGFCRPWIVKVCCWTDSGGRAGFEATVAACAARHEARTTVPATVNLLSIDSPGVSVASQPTSAASATTSNMRHRLDAPARREDGEKAILGPGERRRTKRTNRSGDGHVATFGLGNRLGDLAFELVQILRDIELEPGLQIAAERRPRKEPH